MLKRLLFVLVCTAANILSLLALTIISYTLLLAFGAQPVIGLVVALLTGAVASNTLWMVIFSFGYLDHQETRAENQIK